MEKKKLVIIMAVWKRHELTELALNHLKKLQKKKKFEVVIAGSEGEKSRNLVEPFGFEYIETSNDFLTVKNNAMTLKAKEMNPDGVVILGSDDFVNENVIDKYFELIEEGFDGVFGFGDLYFYDTKTQKMIHHDSGEKSFGAGRFYSRNALDVCDFMPWTGKHKKGCDINSKKHLESLGIKFEKQKLYEFGGFLVDVKHNVNITSKAIMDMGEEVDSSFLSKNGIRIKTGLNKLSKMWEEGLQEEMVEKVESNDHLVHVVLTEKGRNTHWPSEKLQGKTEFRVSESLAKSLIKEGLVVKK